MIAPNRNQPHDPYAEAMASTPDPYAAIERELAAEDAKLGEWPPPQWWREQKAREFNAIDPAEYRQGSGDTRENFIRGWEGRLARESTPPPVNLGTADDPEPLVLGKPWSRRELVEYALFVVLLTGAAALILWGAGR